MSWLDMFRDADADVWRQGYSSDRSGTGSLALGASVPQSILPSHR